MNRTFSVLSVAVIATAACTATPSSEELGASQHDLSGAAAVAATRFTQVDLTSDQPNVAQQQDASLINAWGTSFDGSNSVWISSAGTGLTRTHDWQGILTMLFTVPTAIAGAQSIPTGQAANPNAKDFAGDSIIVADARGTISGWHAGLSRGGVDIRVDRTAARAVYTGLTVWDSTLYATDFKNGVIDVFDRTYAKVATTGFVDATLPAGYAPFNIQVIGGGELYVAYAKQVTGSVEGEVGAGKGYVNAFLPSGKLLGRVASEGTLNEPWAMTEVSLERAAGGALVGKLLIGNHGDGTIQVFDRVALPQAALEGEAVPSVSTFGVYLSALLDRSGKPIMIDGLWSVRTGFFSRLYFTAGPDHGAHGLFGGLIVND